MARATFSGTVAAPSASGGNPAALHIIIRMILFI